MPLVEYPHGDRFPGRIGLTTDEATERMLMAQQ